MKNAKGFAFAACLSLAMLLGIPLLFGGTPKLAARKAGSGVQPKETLTASAKARSPKEKSSQNPPAMPPSAAQRVLLAPWGASPGQFGLSIPHEASAEGPSVLRVGPEGELFFLDVVNGRIQVFDENGAFREAFPLPSETVHTFVAVGSREIVALDRQGEGRLFHLAAERPLRVLPLRSGALGEAGGLTDVAVSRGRAYVEREHGPLFAVTGEDAALPGRPVAFSENHFLRAAVLEKKSGLLEMSLLDAEGARLWAATARAPGFVLHVLMLTSDSQGSVYLGCEAGKEDGDGFTDVFSYVFRFDRNGNPTGVMKLPASTSHVAAVVEPLAIDAQGDVLQMRAIPEGLVVERFGGWAPAP